MRIVIDLDNIVAPTLLEWLVQYNEISGDHACVSDVVEYDLSAITQRRPKHSAKTLGLLQERSFYQALPPVPGAPTGIMRLAMRHSVVLATARPPHVEWTTQEWVRRHIGVHENLALHFRAEKRHYLSADVLLDDAPHVLRICHIALQGTRLATIGYPFNRSLQREPWVHVVGTWMDLSAAWAAFVRWIEEIDSCT